MKGMASAKEYFVPPPKGRYPCKVTAVSSEFSKKGATMLKLELRITEAAGEHAGATCTDYIITDGTAPGGGMGKTKLRGLGVNVDSSDAEVPDAELCNMLLEREVIVDFDHDPIMKENAITKKYDIPATAFDAQLNKEVQLFRLAVKGYYQHGVGTTAPVAQAPQQQYQQAPQQQFQQPPAQQFQQPVQQPPAQPQFQGPPPGWQPQQAAPVQAPPQQQFQGPPAGYAPPQGGPPPGWAPPAGGQPPFNPQQGQGYAPPNGTPPWVQQGQAPVAADDGGKKKRAPKSA